MAVKTEAVARTRKKIHTAAIKLFTKKGFHGTGIREIAREAGVSLGNLYNHHKNKEELFTAIMEDMETDYTAPGTPLDKAFDEFDGVDDFEKLGAACGEMVAQFRDYIRLIYVDVVELSGKHLQKLYGGMRERYTKKFGDRLEQLGKQGKFTTQDPISAMMVTTMTFFFYYNIRDVFGVGQFFSESDEQAVSAMSMVLRNGVKGVDALNPMAQMNQQVNQMTAAIQAAEASVKGA